eukprot:gb/GEZN01002314.1/.p1 GENE.gb/GEZN01002314.1/~~gb/GEZN01002314.1/.p1  ORF type:complete len:747 (+),score=137.04 gb/GEZN01002314.1/:74-2314(+)
MSSEVERAKSGREREEGETEPEEIEPSPSRRKGKSATPPRERGEAESRSSRKKGKGRSEDKPTSPSQSVQDEGTGEGDKMQSAQEKAIEMAEEAKRRASKKLELQLTRSGGAYVPPFKLARLKAQITDKKSRTYQRLAWDSLRKSINGLINKVNTTNIKFIIPEIFAENLVRGRGLVCRSVMKAQMASPGFTHVYAGLMAVLNTKMPELGELLLKRIIMQFRKAYKRNDKLIVLACTKFMAHLVNQQMAHELLSLQLLTLLLETPTDDSVEVAVDFVKECGQILTDISPKGIHRIFERFRAILHEGEIDKRVQYMIEGLFLVRKSGFEEFPAVMPELDLVDLDDQITHELSLDDIHDTENAINIFKFDPDYEENEKQYEEIKKEILGESDESGGEGEGGSDSSEESEESEEEGKNVADIQDKTEATVINMRRRIYMCIMSSLNFQECAHKLLGFPELEGQEVELCNMMIECCSQERTYLKFYGLLGQRFCEIDVTYQEKFDECFALHYATIHRFETNRLRNIAKFFAHLLYTDAFDWSVLSYIRLNEEDTTSSSRIFIKILFRELSELMGLAKLKARLDDAFMQEYFSGLFPKDHPKNTRFAINFFTSIGLGGLTENLRLHLKNMPKMLMAQKAQVEKSDSEDSSEDESSDDDSSSDSSDSSSSSSESSGDDSDSSDSGSDSDKDKSAKSKAGKRKENERDKGGSGSDEAGGKDKSAKSKGKRKESRREKRDSSPPPSKRQKRRDS